MTAKTNANVRWLREDETGEVLFVLQVSDPESLANCESCDRKVEEFFEVHLGDDIQMIFCADHVTEGATWVNGPDDTDQH